MEKLLPNEIFIHNEKIPVANELITAGKKLKSKLFIYFLETK